MSAVKDVTKEQEEISNQGSIKMAQTAASMLKKSSNSSTARSDDSTFDVKNIYNEKAILPIAQSNILSQNSGLFPSSCSLSTSDCPETCPNIKKYNQSTRKPQIDKPEENINLAMKSMELHEPPKSLIEDESRWNKLCSCDYPTTPPEKDKCNRKHVKEELNSSGNTSNTSKITSSPLAETSLLSSPGDSSDEPKITKAMKLSSTYNAPQKFRAICGQGLNITQDTFPDEECELEICRPTVGGNVSYQVPSSIVGQFQGIRLTPLNSDTMQLRNIQSINRPVSCPPPIQHHIQYTQYPSWDQASYSRKPLQQRPVVPNFELPRQLQSMNYVPDVISSMQPQYSSNTYNPHNFVRSHCLSDDNRARQLQGTQASSVPVTPTAMSRYPSYPMSQLQQAGSISTPSTSHHFRQSNLSSSGFIRPRPYNMQTSFNRGPASVSLRRLADFGTRPGRECKFCKNNGETQELYRSHVLRNPSTGQLICPVLREHICEMCGATGDKAHTRNYCPAVKAEKKLKYALPLHLKKTKHQSDGQVRSGTSGISNKNGMDNETTHSSSDSQNHSNSAGCGALNVDQTRYYH